MTAVFKVHAPYPPVPPFVWPKEGKRTWQPPELSFFGACRPGPDCCGGVACPVGVRTVGSGVYGCDGQCHAADRVRLGCRGGSSPLSQRAPNSSTTRRL